MEHPIKAARERRNITQEELEARSGVSQATISRYEAKPAEGANLWAAMALCRSLGLTVEEAFSADFETIRRQRAERAAQGTAAEVAEKGAA